MNPKVEQLPKVLIAAIPYDHRSGGVKLLYALADTLRQSGIEARLIFFFGSDDKQQRWSWARPSDEYLSSLKNLAVTVDQYQSQDELQEILETGITVYPDLIKGNPLGAKHVVRYVLNENEEQFRDDFVLLFSRIFRDKYHYVLFNPLVNECMNEEGAIPWHQRRMDATYLGKGPGFLQCDRIPGTILIERTHPKTQEELAIILKNTRFIFNYDCVTALNFDAIMCGAVPVLMHDAQIPRSKINGGEIGQYPTIEFGKTGIVKNQSEVTRAISAQREQLIEHKNKWPANVMQLIRECKNYFALG